MSIITWMLVGLVAGWLASVIMRTNSSQGMLMDVIMGMIGSVVGGFLTNLLGLPGASGLNIWSVAVATLGAVILIAIGRALRTTT